MNIIITRPENDSKSLAKRLEAMGHYVFMMPLISIVVRPAVSLPKKNYQAICFTSANGVRSLGSIAGLENYPVIAVGPQSLDAALKAGFRNVSAQGGDVEGIVYYITRNCNPHLGPLLYISGSETSGDLEGKLTLAGFMVDRVITYDALPSNLSNDENKIGQSDAVMLYSPRSAKIWQAEIMRLDLQNAAEKITHYCLSANIATALPKSWPKIVAKFPTEASILAALE